MTPSAAKQLTTIPFGQEQNTNQRIINETFIRNAFDMNGIKFASIPISQMIIDEDYQRPASRKVNKIAKEWYIAKCGVITVSYRDNRFYIVDGQHRFLAAKMVGEECLPCQIHTGLTKQQEAMMFANQGDGTTKVSMLDKHNAKNTGEDPSAMKISEICEDFHITLGKRNGITTGCIRSMTVLNRMYSAYGENELRWVFSLIRDAGWRDVKGGYSDDVLGALHQIYFYNRKNLDDVRPVVLSLLSETTPHELNMSAYVAYPNRGNKSALIAYIDRYISQYREAPIIHLSL